MTKLMQTLFSLLVQCRSHKTQALFSYDSLRSLVMSPRTRTQVLSNLRLTWALFKKAL
ncbi:hypothetical protein BC628DRAFT_1372176 [Trametes gibbosa]|nr:hypothetical protein BC628DRAFT_1372176 [Trametes gibbosa]